MSRTTSRLILVGVAEMASRLAFFDKVGGGGGLSVCGGASLVGIGAVMSTSTPS